MMNVKSCMGSITDTIDILGTRLKTSRWARGIHTPGCNKAFEPDTSVMASPGDRADTPALGSDRDQTGKFRGIPVMETVKIWKMKRKGYSLKGKAGKVVIDKNYYGSKC